MRVNSRPSRSSYPLLGDGSTEHTCRFQMSETLESILKIDSTDPSRQLSTTASSQVSVSTATKKIALRNAL